MEKSEGDKSGSSDEGSHLGRNRSFKSKQLVRSQAIRESQSPPRTVSPAAIVKHNDTLINTQESFINTKETFVNTKESFTKCDAKSSTITNTKQTEAGNVEIVTNEVASNDTIVVNVNDKVINASDNDASSHTSDERSSVNSLVTNDERIIQRVEIQITPGWEEPPTEQRQRTRRWLGNGPGHSHGHGPNGPGHRQHSRDLLSNNPRVACVCGTCAACPHCRGRRRRPACPAKQDSGIDCSDECPDCCDSEHAGPMEGGRKASSLDTDAYCHCPQRKEKPKSISRTDSDEKSEPTGLDLVNFIKDTLNKNGRDRLTLLKIEKELHSLVNDTGRCIVRFPVMTSYGRMLVHRCAALFQLSHHLDQTNKSCVLVSKSGTSGGRIPCTSFKQWCTSSFPPSPQRRTPDHVNAKSILKRDAHSLESPCAGAALTARSRSLEQRERDYERVRNKIFNSESCGQSGSGWGWLNSGGVRLLTPDGRNRLLKVQSLESAAPSVRARTVPGSGDAASPGRKSHSFGGYGQPDQEPPRVLSRQGDLASSSWRLSPSSSGYRTLSLHSTDSVTPSPTGGASPEPTAHTAHALAGSVPGSSGSAPGSSGPGAGAVLWAVTDLGAVPHGALVIEPQTGRPLTNPDGSVYRFDPNNPPVLYDIAAYDTHGQRKTEPASEKRRGRLEKQHSFIDSECACQPTEESRAKCFCDGRQRSADKVTHSSQKSAQKPQSPCKKRYEKPENPTNRSTPKDCSANHRTAYETTTNQKEDKSFESQGYASTNTRIDQTARQYESSNQRQEPRTFEIQRPQSYDSQKHESTNQRSFYELTNHRPNKLSNQESQDYGTQYYGHSYLPTYGHDELSPPPQPQPVPHYTPVESAPPVPVTSQPKSVATLPDSNMRPLSLTNMAVYPPPLPQYPYQSLTVYQPMPVEEHKPVPVATSAAQADTTFRIDPSYPYQPVDYGQCGACSAPCVDPALHQQRGYPVTYAPVNAAMAAPEAHTAPYPVAGVFLPQPMATAHYPYADPIGPWNGIPVPVDGRLLSPELYPTLQCPVYIPHGYQTHQMISPQYQVYPPMYPIGVDQRRNSLVVQRSKRNSLSGSSRATPLQTPPDDRKPGEDAPNSSVVMATNGRDVSRQNSCDIAVKIQQIKDQMAQLNSRDRPKSGPNPTAGHNPTAGPRRDEWKRRNSGNGILGNYPNQHYNARGVQPANDDSQLSTAARAIVNSIRNIHDNKGAYASDRRPDHAPNPHHQRDRRPEQHSRPTSGGHSHVTGSLERPDGRQDRGNVAPFQYRPPFLLRQMSPGTWCRKSPGPIHPALNHPRRPHPDTRNPRR